MLEADHYYTSTPSYAFAEYASTERATQHKKISLSKCIRRNRYSDSLRAGRSRDRISVRLRFSAPVQTGPGAHPTLYIKGARSPSWWLSGQGVALTTHLPSAEDKETVELYFYSPCWPSWPLPKHKGFHTKH